MTQDNNILLPAGFQDIVPPHAADESRLASGLLKNFTQFGYEQVKPPLMEFEQDGKDSLLSYQTFQVMDYSSQKMMSIRADMTIQVARIAANRMMDRKRPIRLSYSGQVLRVKGEGLYKERQLAQSGIELIGDNSPAATLEAIYIAADSFSKLGLTDISIDFGIPSLSTVIMENFDTKQDIKKEIFSFIEAKDIPSIRKIDDKSAAIIANILEISISNESTNIFDILDMIEKNNLPKRALEYCSKLRNIIKLVQKELPLLKVTIDPMERRGFEYHTGLSFSFFSGNSKEELGRGGQYEVAFNGEEAVGFTLSINSLQRALPLTKDKRKVFVPCGVVYSETEFLREEGYITIHSTSERDTPQQFNCGYIYDDKSIKLVENKNVHTD